MATRINLSIPSELKERMDKLTDANWSKVAQETFETHLTIYELKEKNMTTEAGLERLRASKRTNAEREGAEGVAAGKKWATDEAEYDALAKVAALAELDTPDARQLAEALGCDSPSWSEAAAEMDGLFGEEGPSESKISGFIQGAAEIFDQV